MASVDRSSRIAQYASGPDRFRTALARIPHGAVQWRPGPGKWTVHEIVLPCADSETNAHMRLRYLLAEPNPVIAGYDQDHWANYFDYHALPLEPALATIAAVRANTVGILERLDGPAWDRAGHHSEHGRYTVGMWLEIYAGHLDVHIAQMERNVAAWQHAFGLPVLR